MILSIDGKQFEVKREALEAQLQEHIHTLIGQSDSIGLNMKLALKGAADMALSYIGQKPPKGVDKLEYLAAYILHVGLNALENKAVIIEATELASNVTD